MESIVNTMLDNNNLSDTVWGEIISSAASRGGFTVHDKAKAVAWTTCACGNEDDRLMKRVVGIAFGPLDEELYISGLAFNHAVRSDHVTYAADLLIIISQRAALLLKDPLLTRFHTLDTDEMYDEDDTDEQE